MNKIYWLLERVKTYQVLIGKGDWEKTEFEQKLEKLDALYDAVVEEGEAIVNEMIEHYEALRKEREEWNESQVRVRNGK